MSEDVLHALTHSVHQSHPGSIQYRQLEHILKEEQKKRKRKNSAARRQLECLKAPGR